jgi:2-polyprenyl-3-methyl-5-hydroxy-6-metoxy-1,4-benzoquinol methylase
MNILRSLTLFFDHTGSQADAYKERSSHLIRSVEGKTRTYERKAQFMAEAISQSLGDSARVLEVGCGGGHFTEALARRLPNCRIVATDAHQPMLDAAVEKMKHPNVSFKLYDCEGELRGETFDGVCGVDVLHHLGHPATALAHWRQAVRPRGALLLLESNPANPALFFRSLPHAHERRFYLNTPNNLCRWATQSGWASASVDNLPFYLPSGPARWHDAINAAEDMLHRARAVCGWLSGLFFLRAINPSSTS